MSKSNPANSLLVLLRATSPKEFRDAVETLREQEPALFIDKANWLHEIAKHGVSLDDAREFLSEARRTLGDKGQ